MASVVFPSFDLSSQLYLPDVLDFNLANNPNHPIFVFPNDASPGTLTKISMLEYVRACHRAGIAVSSSTQPGDVIGVIANVDSLVYSALLVGMMKAGLVVSVPI